jgi:hypothetical protein
VQPQVAQACEFVGTHDRQAAAKLKHLIEKFMKDLLRTQEQARGLD